jgi:hypothetical protein
VSVQKYWAEQPPKQRLRWKIFCRMDSAEDLLLDLGWPWRWPKWLQAAICRVTSHVPLDDHAGTYCAYCDRPL